MKLKFNIPDTWNDLNAWQLGKVAKLNFTPISTVLYDQELFKILCECKPWSILKRRKIAKLWKYVPVSTIKEKYIPNFYQSYELTTFIPSIKIKKKTYYAPMDRLANLSIHELAICEDIFLRFQSDMEDASVNYGFDHLINLASVLYTLSSNGVRPEFKKEWLVALEDEFSKAPKEFIYATALSYKGCKIYMNNLEEFKTIFPKNTRTSDFADKMTNSGLGDLILSMSNNTFGPYRETANTNAYVFLAEFVKENLKAKKARRDAQRNNTRRRR